MVFIRAGQLTSLHCGEVCGGGVREGTMSLTGLSADFQSLLPLPTSNWALLVLIPRWMGLCTFQDPVGLSNELSCEAGSFSHHCNPHRFLQPEILRLYFPALEPWVAWSVSLPSCSSWFICMQIWNCPVCQSPPQWPCPPATALMHILSASAAHLYPSYQSE